MTPTVVIGGGLAGVTAAHELARRGEAVTLLEAEPELAAVTSFGSGGLLTASMSDPWNGPGVGRHLLSSLFDPYAPMKLHPRVIPGLARWGLRFLRYSSPARHGRATRANFLLADRSVRVTRELSERLGAETHDMAFRGTLKVFDSAAALEASRSVSEALVPRGLRYDVLSADEAVAKEPALAASRERIHSAIFYPDDGAGDSCLFTRALGEHARGMGAEIRTGVDVRRIVVRDGSVRGVEAGDGTIETERVVLAAGCASAALARPLGVRLAIAPAKGYSVTLDMSGWSERPETPVLDDAMHTGLVPLGKRLRLVGTAEFTGFDHTLTRARLDNLFLLFERVYPQLAARTDRASAFEWTGLRPMSADGVPFVGAAGPHGLWMSTGHGHLGWTMSAGSAELLVALMLGDEPAVDPAPYRPDR